MTARTPLCNLFGDLLEPGLIEHLGLDREQYTPAFTRLRNYWIEVLPEHHGKNYVMCAALQLRDILQTPEDWEEIGRYLADATVLTYGNGSHSFVEDTVPALIDSGLARTKEDLKRGIDMLLRTINSGSPGNYRYDGGKVFEQAAKQILAGEIVSINDIARVYPPLNA